MELKFQGGLKYLTHYDIAHRYPRNGSWTQTGMVSQKRGAPTTWGSFQANGVQLLLNRTQSMQSKLLTALLFIKLINLIQEQQLMDQLFADLSIVTGQSFRSIKFKFLTFRKQYKGRKESKKTNEFFSTEFSILLAVFSGNGACNPICSYSAKRLWKATSNFH